MIQIAAVLSAGLWLRGISTGSHERCMAGSVLLSLSLLCWGLQ